MPRHPQQQIKRIDTGKIYETAAAAAESCGCSTASVYLAIKEKRPMRNGAAFEFAGVAAKSPAPALARQNAPSPPSSVKATSPDAVARRVEVENSPSVTSVFAALSAMAAGMRGIKLTDIEISSGGLSVKIKTLEIGSS